MPKKLKPSEDPSLFEYEPHEDEVPDDELFECMYEGGEDPETILQSEFKKEYLAYIAKQK